MVGRPNTILNCGLNAGLNSGAAPRGRSGFTLIEALIAVGAMALVSVGIAAVFQSVGKTITTGRRLNTLNNYAAMIEQVMRRDFEAMTRDGFLVIRNNYADPDVSAGTFDATKDVVKLSAADRTPRPRRVDEIVFFAKGDFSSMREPLDPRFVAKSEEAKIYYGHGLRMTAAEPNSAFLDPDINRSITNAKNRLGAAGPNQYAKTWTLLRQPTLLIKPGTASQQLPTGQVFQWNTINPAQAAFLRDKPGQVALQPAAWSLFRRLNTLLPQGNTYSYVRASQRGATGAVPSIASGLVDIATEDLAGVRSIVMTMPSTTDPVTSNDADLRTAYADTARVFSLIDAGQAPVAMHRWMDEVFPGAAPDAPTPVTAAQRGLRVRYESGPVDYIGSLVSTGVASEKAAARVDQLALGASNFLPGCTEFIVEFSFGLTDLTTGELIWHGLQREADVGNGTKQVLVRPYPLRPKGNVPFGYALQYRNFKGEIVPPQGSLPRPEPQTLLYSKTPDPKDLSQTAHFGYFSPYRSNTDGKPWAWPTLIRVTISLSDPAPGSPDTEETFQFVFPTPGNPL